MKRLLSLIAVTSLLVVVSGCGSEAVDPMVPTSITEENRAIVGVWVTRSGYYNEYRADGTWGFGYRTRESLANPHTWGTYTFDGDTFTTYVDTASEACVGRDPETQEPAGMVGVYTVTFSEDGAEQFREVVNDPCSARAGETTRGLTRHSGS